MAKQTRLGDLERAVMDHLWSAPQPQTVRQVHEALSQRRDLAYTTVMTVLQRLGKKNLVSQIREARSHCVRAGLDRSWGEDGLPSTGRAVAGKVAIACPARSNGALASHRRGRG